MIINLFIEVGILEVVVVILLVVRCVVLVLVVNWILMLIVIFLCDFEFYCCVCDGCVKVVVGFYFC